MNLHELEQIKNRVISEKALDKNRKSSRITVGMGTCGIKAGARDIMEEINQVLGGNKDVVVTHVGCIGLCSYEPVLEVAMPDRPVVTYGKMNPFKVREVIKEHLLGGNPIDKWIVSIR